MKKYIIALMGTAALLGFTGCAGDEHRHVSTTTTEETHVSRPVVQQTTTETRQRSVY